MPGLLEMGLGLQQMFAQGYGDGLGAIGRPDFRQNGVDVLLDPRLMN